MANPFRGEIDAVFNDRHYTLCLTLGALAELETHFGADGLQQLAERLSKPLAAADLTAILTAGLKGGGHDVVREDVAEMRHAEGAAGFARIAAQLLETAFQPASDAAADQTERP